MSRSGRVRDLTTWELEREVSRHQRDAVVEALLGDEPAFDAAQRRLRRVMRELARRDYRHRSHGQKCHCSDCMALLDRWRELQRRNITYGDESPD